MIHLFRTLVEWLPKLALGSEDELVRHHYSVAFSGFRKFGVVNGG